MIKFTLPVLAKLGFAAERIYTTLKNRMKCGLGKCGRCNIGATYVCKDGPVFTAARWAGCRRSSNLWSRARAWESLKKMSQPEASAGRSEAGKPAAQRVGVYLLQAAGSASDGLDLQRVAEIAAHLPGVCAVRTLRPSGALHPEQLASEFATG